MMPNRFELALAKGSDRRALSGHPWIYSNEIAMTAAARDLPPGTLVRLVTAEGHPLGTASFNPHTLLAARVFDRDPEAEIDHAWLVARMERALGLRRRLFGRPWYRLIHAEADGLPGLVVDRHGDVVVAQLNTAGMDRLADLIVEALVEVTGARVVVLRNDTPARALEKLDSAVAVARGTVDGPVPVEEGGLTFLADVTGGQKTGWFYDQRPQRAQIAALAEGARVLDLFCHAGGFALAAARAGAASVSAVDKSAAAIVLAARAAEANGLVDRVTLRRADALAALEHLEGAGERFDIVIADPPAYARSRRDAQPALRAYRKLARQCARVTAPGGILMIASCSFVIEVEAFRSAVSRGLADAGRTGSLIFQGGAGPDHPVHSLLPETGYLKSLTFALDHA